MISIYNTLTRQKDAFTPINDGVVTLYSCGPTVYDYPHIGNWYAFIRWDLLVRTLRASGYDVKWVMNITDVGHLVSDADDGEDKLEKGAKREGKTAWEVADYYGKYFLNALERLHFTTITYTPKATAYIQEQIALVQSLENNGFTYIIDDGVYFDTAKFPTYASFARLNMDALKAGARVEFNEQKRNTTDFALWKFSPKNEKRDMEWESPWGKGFPGWHIECSAMSMKLLGDTLDIHTGGIDHIPVHHTNEIAQSEGATGKKFANYWMHSNFIKVDGKKMSKSLGNLITLEDIEQKGILLSSFRLLVMESHYRNEAQFTWGVLQAAQNRYENWLSAADIRWQTVDTAPQVDLNFSELLNTMHNDIDTPTLLELLDKTFATIQSNGLANSQRAEYDAFLENIESLTGLELLLPDISDTIKNKLAKRLTARKNGNWATSDSIRDELLADGYVINDSKDTQRWIRKLHITI